MEKGDIKLFVLDLMYYYMRLYPFKEHDVVVPITVLEKLDQIKDRKRDVGLDALFRTQWLF